MPISPIIKHTFDFLISLLILIFALPFLGIVSILIWITMGRPILFCQIRAGRNGVPFTLYKFRTMRNDVDKQGNLLSDADRLTHVGTFVRKFSLDELPQMINILKGDMSLIGPRPLLPEYLPLYSERHARRHDVRPGLTGLAQVMGRKDLPFSQRFEYDCEYVTHYSLGVDMKIFFLTPWRVLFQHGNNASQSFDDIDDLGFWDHVTRARNNDQETE
jgi:lipopolysaccharide/colanic/teichoic acid biosynthesis glycosyltransferase